MSFVGVVVLLCVVFFFQAEDGIRDLVRSRGLGDVYKRQAEGARLVAQLAAQGVLRPGVLLLLEAGPADEEEVVGGLLAVSYTHLTLPTSDLV